MTKETGRWISANEAFRDSQDVRTPVTAAEVEQSHYIGIRYRIIASPFSSPEQKSTARGELVAMGVFTERSWGAGERVRGTPREATRPSSVSAGKTK